MQARFLAGIIAGCVLLSACDGIIGTGSDDDKSNPDDSDKTNISGAAQKGPFVSGSKITITSLLSDGTPLDVIAETETIDDIGNYVFATDTFGLVEITATGHHLSELSGTVSDTTLTLKAIDFLKEGETRVSYVNLLTHIGRDRILALLADGVDPEQAIEQSKQELRTILDPVLDVDSNTPIENFNKMTIYNVDDSDSDSNAYLLSVSAMFYGYAETLSNNQQTPINSELDNIIDGFTNDFADDGGLSSNLVVDELITSAVNIDPETIENNLRTHSRNSGTSLEPADLEQLTFSQRFKEGHPRSISHADFNNDGLVDAYITTEASNHLLLGSQSCPRGSYCFVDPPEQADNSNDSHAALLADLDGDEDIDIFVANFGANKIYFNDGNAAFTDSGQSLSSAISHSADIADIDQDGDLDIYVANNSEDEVWLNQGNGFFPTPIFVGITESKAVSLLDVDEDGDNDAFVGTEQGEYILLNDGQGNFTVSEQTQLSSNHFMRLEKGDVDNDGDLDILATSKNLDDDEIILFSNSGQGTFTISHTWTQPVATLADTDGDGDLDVNFIFESVFNDGEGRFADTDSPLSNNFVAEQLALTDVDGDNDLDRFILIDAHAQAYIEQEAQSHIIPLSARNPLSIALGDLDNDDDIDAFLGNFSANRVWQNNGSGLFELSGTPLGSDTLSSSVALGDVDGDNDLDAVVGGWGNKVVWLNDGQGRFSESPLTNPTAMTSTRIKLADFDLDGDLDIYLAQFDDDFIWVNNGNGSFDQTVGMPTDISRDVAVGDLDNDGDIDIVTANESTESGAQIWLNNGSQVLDQLTFSQGELIAVSTQEPITALDLNDIDNDQDLDLIIANAARIRIWTNDGAGEMSLASEFFNGPPVTRIASGDLDGDQLADLFLAGGGPSRIWLNDDNATYRDSGLSLGETFAFDVALADIDGDGDKDAVTATGGVFSISDIGSSEVWINNFNEAPAE